MLNDRPPGSAVYQMLPDPSSVDESRRDLIPVPCSTCGDNVGTSPTGSWCNTCGYSSPGYLCSACGRDYVGMEHTRIGDGEPCSLSEADLARSPAI